MSQWRGGPIQATEPLKLNFDDKLIVTAYNTLFSGTGKLHGNSVSITKKDYSEGYTIIVADLTLFEIGDNFNLKAEGTPGGTLSIDFGFQKSSRSYYQRIGSCRIRQRH